MGSLKRAFQAVWALAALLVLPATLACGGGHSSPPPPTPPSITTQPASQTVLEGATATFSVVAAGSTPFTYQWNKGGTAITGATSASYTTPATVLADSGSSFTVTVTNSAGNVTSSAAALTVYPNPTITSFTAATASGSPAAAITITNGDTATLAFVFSGGTGSIDNGVGTVTSGTNVTVTPTTTTTYTLTVDNGHSTTKTAQVTVTVVPAPAAPTITAPANVTLGGTYTASVVAQAGMTYTWTATNGTITGGQGTNQITFTAGASGSAMSLGCVVANAAGATASGSMNMTMVMAPVATSLTPSTATPLYGATVTLTPLFAGGTGSIDNGIGTVMTGTPYTTAALKAATTFTLTVTNMAGTTATTTTTVTPQTVAVSLSPTTKTVTTGDVVTFTGGAANAVNTAVTWTASGGASITSAGVWTAPSTPGSYTVTATSVADPTKSATATMTVVAPPNATITPSATTLSTGKTGTASVPVQATGTTYLWSATGATITTATNAASITFTTGAVGSATLSCTVTNAAGLPTTGTSTVTVVALPTASMAASTTNPLYGATNVTVTPTFANATSAKVGTTQGGSDVSASASSGVALPVQASGFTAATTYWVRATNAAGDYVDASVAIAPQTVAVTISPTSKSVTVGDVVGFTATVSGAQNTGVIWAASTGVITVTGSTASWTAPSSAGTATITATSAADGTKVATATITVYAAPVATITPSNPTVATGATGLTASVPSQQGASYAWSITNGTGMGTITAGTTASTVTYSATAAGTFTLNVVVTNAAGASAPGSSVVTVVNSPVINSFSASTTGVVSGGAVTLSYNFANGTGLITGSDGYTSASLTAGTGTVTVNPTATPSVTYTLTVTGGSGITPAVQTVTVNVSTPLTFTTNLASTATAFVGTNYTFNVVVSGTPAANSYDWYFNGSKVTTTTTPSYTLSNVQAANQGSYYVVATNGIISVTSATLNLTVNTGSTISGHVYLVNSGNTGVANVEVVLSQGANILTRVNTDSTGLYSFPFLANGTYTVTPDLVASGVSAGFLPASSSVSVNGSNMTADFQAVIGYSVSGTVNYSGTKTGRVYLVLTGQSGQVNGVSIVGPTGAFTIRGVAPGNCTLTAYMDTIGLGNANANDPSTASPINLSISSGPLTGISVNLVDPATVTLSSAPSFKGIVSFSTGALVNYQPLVNSSNVETPTSYDVQWSTSSSFTTVAGTLHFPAQTDHNPMCFVHGLTDGTPYYFQIRGNVGSTHGPWSAASSPVTPGATSGAYTVSGTITLPVTPTGPLAVALVDKANNKFFITWFQTPSATQSFTLAGVPAGTYGLYGILDQNNNGIIDTGDLSNTGGNGASVVVSTANVTGANLALSGANAIAVLNTQHWQQTGTYTGQGYNLNFRVNGNVQLPVNVAVNFGTTANPAWVDIGLGNQGDRYAYWMQWIRPTVGEAFPLQVAYSDGTSDSSLSATVTGVLDSFAQNLAPQAPTSTGTTPTFSWIAPATPPASYTYEVGIWNSGNTLWYISGLPSSQTSVVYNSDGSATQSTLTAGVTYQWAVNVVDANGNSAQYQVDYKP